MMNKRRLNIPIVLIVALLIFGCNTLYSQKDTLYVNHLDTVKLNIDQPLIPVISCTVDDSKSIINVHFQLTTNNKNLVVFNKVHSGGGSVIFGHYQGKRFIDGKLNCQLKHALPDLNSSIHSQKRGVQFIFYESANGQLIKNKQWFTWIGGRKSKN